MSDNKETIETVKNKKPEDKKHGKKSRSETATAEKRLADKDEKFEVSLNSGEQRSISSPSSNVEEHSGKNPKLKKDLKELFDNFGQEHLESHLENKPPIYFSDIKQDIYTESYTQESENVALTDDLRENNKDSLEDSTLDGKFIEIKDESCDFPVEKCTCGNTDQNCTDIDDSQMHSETNKISSYDFCTHPAPHYASQPKECNYNDENPHFKSTNRYNYNQVQIRHKQSDRTMLSKLFPRREMVKKHRVNKDDSGETIPQLYKANVKNLWNCGITPERFTFKAVTGNLPGKLQYTQCCHYPCMNPCVNPCFSSVKHRVNFVDDDFMEIQDKKQRKRKKEKRCIFKQFKRNKNTKHAEENKSFLNHGINKNDHAVYNNQHQDRACLQFEGNEYVSTKQLPDRIDIYCFDHLNTSYFRTCDQPPPLITDIAMEKTEEVATRFWAEIFGFIHVIIAFFIAFILQFYKFMLYSIVRPLLVGLVQLTSDYFFKPLLTITYNGFTQPFLVFLFNVAASLRDLCSPIAKGIGYFVSEIAVLLRAIRLVDCGRNTHYRQMKDSCC